MRAAVIFALLGVCAVSAMMPEGDGPQIVEVEASEPVAQLPEHPVASIDVPKEMVIPTAILELPPEDSQGVAQFVVDALDAASNSVEKFSLGRVVKAEQTVVMAAGAPSKYDLELELTGDSDTTQFVTATVTKNGDDYQLDSHKRLFSVVAAAPGPPEEDTPEDPDQPLLMGGFSAAQDLSAAMAPSVRSAAVVLARSASDLVGEGARVVLCSAEKQVVAGMNYKIAFTVDPPEGAECESPHNGVVYAPFSGAWKPRLLD